MESNEKQRKIDTFLTQLNEKGHFNGNVLIAENSEIIYEKALGIADFGSGRKLNTGTVFDLASVSKAMTAMAIMILKERGIIRYQDQIDQFFTAFPYKGITVKHLLTHTSGLPDYIELFLEKWDRSKVATNEDIIEMLRIHQPKVLFQPGEQFAYSNTGYTLLALIVEKVSKISFAEFLKKNIFEPLGMKDTRIINRRLGHAVPSNYAFGYIRTEQPMDYQLPENLPETDFVLYMDGMQGDGAVNSTVEDLYKWDRALYTDRLVSLDTLSEAFSPVELLDHSTFGYGFGWGILNEGRGKVLRHSGGWPGYKTMLIRYVDLNKVMIVLCNVEQPEDIWKETIKTLETIIFDEDKVRM